jgi:hypothetical protein
MFVTISIPHSQQQAVVMAEPSDDIALAGAFAWHKGILYYGKPSIVLELLPAFGL